MSPAPREVPVSPGCALPREPESYGRFGDSSYIDAEDTPRTNRRREDARHFAPLEMVVPIHFSRELEREAAWLRKELERALSAKAQPSQDKEGAGAANVAPRNPPRPIRPRVGDTWAFGGPGGRQVTITRIAVGAAGSFGVQEGRIVPITKKKQAVYVHATPLCATQSVSEFLRNWSFVRRGDLPAVCEWRFDPEAEVWLPGCCSEAFCFTGADMIDDRFKFCPCCGKPLKGGRSEFDDRPKGGGGAMNPNEVPAAGSPACVDFTLLLSVVDDSIAVADQDVNLWRRYGFNMHLTENKVKMRDAIKRADDLKALRLALVQSQNKLAGAVGGKETTK